LSGRGAQAQRYVLIIQKFYANAWEADPMRSISRYGVLSLLLFVLPILQADFGRAAPSLQGQDVSHLVPPTLNFANSFVQTLSDSGWSIKRVGLSIYNGGMGGTTKAAWIKTDKGVLEVLFYETSAEVKRIRLKENDDSTPNYHKYTVRWPNTHRPSGFEGRLPVYFTKYGTILIISYDRDLADALDKLFGAKKQKRT
jgi:hypothetical protein